MFCIQSFLAHAVVLFHKIENVRSLVLEVFVCPFREVSSVYFWALIIVELNFFHWFYRILLTNRTCEGFKLRCLQLNDIKACTFYYYVNNSIYLINNFVSCFRRLILNMRILQHYHQAVITSKMTIGFFLNFNKMHCDCEMFQNAPKMMK